MHIQLWCKTHDCAVIEVDPSTPAFEFNSSLEQFEVRWDNTYCTFDNERERPIQDHEYLFGVVPY